MMLQGQFDVSEDKEIKILVEEAVRVLYSYSCFEGERGGRQWLWRAS